LVVVLFSVVFGCLVFSRTSAETIKLEVFEDKVKQEIPIV
jgi:hypothetical protein